MSTSLAAMAGERLSGSYGEMSDQNESLDQEGEQYANVLDTSLKGRANRLLWHGGSLFDAWFSAASNQVSMLLCDLLDCC